SRRRSRQQRAVKLFGQRLVDIVVKLGKPFDRRKVLLFGQQEFDQRTCWNKARLERRLHVGVRIYRMHVLLRAEWNCSVWMRSFGTPASNRPFDSVSMNSFGPHRK